MMLLFWLIIAVMGLASLLALSSCILSSRSGRRDPFEV